MLVDRAVIILLCCHTLRLINLDFVFQFTNLGSKLVNDVTILADVEFDVQNIARDLSLNILSAIRVSESVKSILIGQARRADGGNHDGLAVAAQRVLVNYINLRALK